MCNQTHDLVVLVFTFATETPLVRDVRATETDSGRLHAHTYPLDYHGMSMGRLNQFTLVNTVRKNAASLAAVTVVRKEDAIEQSQIFFRRVKKALARLKAKAERIAAMKTAGTVRRAFVFDPGSDQYAEVGFMDVKKGDRFFVLNPDGSRPDPNDWVACTNAFWTEGYVGSVISEPWTAKD